MTCRVILAVEDALSEAIARKLLVYCSLDVGSVLGLRGNGYLRRRVVELNRTANKLPVLLLTDLDRPTTCASDLIRSWIPGPRNALLLFRVAVVEVESWLLADRDIIAEFFGVSKDVVPNDTDGLPDPKEFLLALAKRCRKRSLRQDLLPAKGSTARIGPGYNPTLRSLVNDRWCPERAAKISPSLKRAMVELTRLRRSGG